jgi:hypothetical protein
MSLELQDIFQQFGAGYRESHRLPLQQLKTMSATNPAVLPRWVVMSMSVIPAAMNGSPTIPAAIAIVPNVRAW